MKIKVLDILIILAVIATLSVGFLTYKHFRQTASKQIESTSKIAFQVYLRGVTITGTENPIKVNEKTFISIRNVPYTELKVINTDIKTKKTVVPMPSGPQPFAVIDDFSQMYMYDIIVTVEDTAQITKDGAVVGGNKIKIGLPITLEGKDYKFNGSVSNVQILGAETTPVAKSQAPVESTEEPAKTTEEEPAQAQTQTQPIAQ